MSWPEATKISPWDLTPTEVAVLHHAMNGASAKVTAKAMKTSPRTTETHLLHIRSKMKVTNTIQAAVAFARWEERWQLLKN